VTARSFPSPAVRENERNARNQANLQAGTRYDAERAEEHAGGRHPPRPAPPSLAAAADHGADRFRTLVPGAALGRVAYRALNPDDPSWAQVQPSDFIAAASIAASLGLFIISGREAANRQRSWT